MIEEKLSAFASLSPVHQVAYSFVLQIRDDILSRYASKKEAEMEMLLTHLAMAYIRQANNVLITPMFNDVRHEIVEHELYPSVITLWTALTQVSDMQWHANEVDYIHAHLLALLIEE